MKRLNWIDILKGIAILTVILDHIFTLFPKTRIAPITWHTYFSVNWFIFLSAIANTHSISKKSIHMKTAFSFWIRRFDLFLSYAIAALLYYVIYTFLRSHPVSFIDYIISIFSFSVSVHFYFIRVILELYLLFPFLYVCFKIVKSNFLHIAIVFATTVISMVFFHIAKPPWEYGKLWLFMGYPYLLTFILGILYEMYYKKYERQIIFFSSVIFIILELYLIVSHGSFSVSNPNLALIVWSLSLLFICKISIEKFLSGSSRFSTVLAELGKKSFYIYLYHFLILSLLSHSY